MLTGVWSAQCLRSCLPRARGARLIRRKHRRPLRAGSKPRECDRRHASARQRRLWTPRRPGTAPRASGSGDGRSAKLSAAVVWANRKPPAHRAHRDGHPNRIPETDWRCGHLRQARGSPDQIRSFRAAVIRTLQPQRRRHARRQLGVPDQQESVHGRAACRTPSCCFARHRREEGSAHRRSKHASATSRSRHCAGLGTLHAACRRPRARSRMRPDARSQALRQRQPARSRLVAGSPRRPS